ncbi:MAG: hypothetical protein U0174_11600 [Polyangiaceae bacterium]
MKLDLNVRRIRSAVRSNLSTGSRTRTQGSAASYGNSSGTVNTDASQLPSLTATHTGGQQQPSVRMG